MPVLDVMRRYIEAVQRGDGRSLRRRTFSFDDAGRAWLDTPYADSCEELVEPVCVEDDCAPVALLNLFSPRSGPIGDPPRPSADKAVEVDPIVERTQAREHRLFAGKLDKSRLSFAERAVVLAVRAAPRASSRLGRDRGLGRRHREGSAVLTHTSAPPRE